MNPSTRPRASSEASKTPHSISLKVLRLSRPQLTQQHPLPFTTPSSNLNYRLDPAASLAHPTDPDSSHAFTLTPALLLPSTFGSIFVGSTFTCTLCANNEHPSSPIHDVKIIAEIQLPGVPAATRLNPSNDADLPVSLQPGATLQRIISTDLPEEGVYTLAVTVSYLDAPVGETPPQASLDPSSAPRPRTFRKLYQFAAHQLLAVRTKARPIPARARTSGPAEDQADTPRRLRWAVEAQLENTGNVQVVLDTIAINCVEGFSARGLNAWDAKGGQGQASLVLSPREIQQVAFIVSVSEDKMVQVDGEGRIVFGQLRIAWKGAMGERGVLNTGWLSARRA